MESRSNPASAPVSVLIVEDVEMMRSLLQSLIQAIPGFSVSGTAGNTWEARLELSRRRPALVLLDEILPGESSTDLIADIKAAGEGIAIILLTSLEDPKHSLPAGALARIVKPGWDSIKQDQKRIEDELRAALGTLAR